MTSADGPGGRVRSERSERLVVHLEPLGVDDASELFAAILRSRALHEPWVTPPASEDDLRESLGQPADTRVTYGIRESTGQLAGVSGISSIIRGPFQNGFISYYALVPHEGRGLMSAGLTETLGRAFGELALHRLEASIQPGNDRSARLVERLGFRLEGHSPRYLKIGGAWRDHDRYALTVEEWTDDKEPG